MWCRIGWSYGFRCGHDDGSVGNKKRKTDVNLPVSRPMQQCHRETGRNYRVRKSVDRRGHITWPASVKTMPFSLTRSSTTEVRRWLTLPCKEASSVTNWLIWARLDTANLIR